MKKHLIVLSSIFLLFIVLISNASAATLGFDTVNARDPKGETNYYINVPGNGMTLEECGDVWQNSMVIDVRVSGTTTVPQWLPLKLVSGQALELSRWEDEYNPNRDYYYRWEVTNHPETIGDSVYEVSCIVDGETLSTTVTIHCKEAVIPTGLTLVNLGDEVHAVNGTEIIFWPEITPEGWQIPGYPQLRWGFDDEVDRFAHTVPVKNDQSTDPYIDINDRNKLTFFRSGEYDSTYVITSDKISVGRLVHFIIDPDWSFYFPEDIRVIEANSFDGTDARSVYIPNGCEKIGAGAFANSGIVYIFIPSTVKEIGEEAIPEDTVIYTPEGSFAYDWASLQEYDVYIMVE